MRVPSFTQRHGTFAETTTYTESYVSPDPSQNWTTTFSPKTWESIKSDKVKGDHKSPTPYTRRVRKVIQNKLLKTSIRRADGTRAVHERETVLRVTNMAALTLDFNTSALEENARRESNVKAILRIADAKAQLAVDLAEANKTYGMIADNARAIALALLAARRGRWGEIPGHLGMNRRDVLSGRFAANRWLEYQYGWKPLFGSLYDYQEAYKAGLRKKDFLVTGKGTGRYSASPSTEWKEGAWRRQVNGRVTTKYTARVRNPRLQKANELGVLNPAAIGWELVPFSFVVDWFVPIGDVLSAWTATAGLEFVSGYQTASCFHAYMQEQWRETDRETTLTNSQYEQHDYVVGRRVLNSFGMPLPYADTDPFGTGKGARGASALALIRQLLR